MTGPAGDPVPREEFVRTWAAAIHGACFVPMSRAERCAFLGGLAGRLATALRRDPFDPAAGYETGAALVAADYTDPEVLARTVTVLHTLPAYCSGLPAPDLPERLAAMVGAVAAGFTRAARDRTLAAQEEVRRASTVARAETERALRDSEARSRYAALHDPLTDLPNETRFTDRLAELLTDPPPGARLGICHLDLDRFGAINDSLGLPVGDGLLVAVADRLRALATEQSCLVARRSGDRFAILAEVTTCAEDMTKVADRALAALAAPFRVDGQEMSISASAGVVERPAAGGSVTELMRAADMALRWAKADGKGRWAQFEEQRSHRDVARHRLSSQLPGAMHRGEFTLDYQPLVNLGTSGVVGFEALARWRHPEHGRLGADRFVGHAEDTGLIVPLGIRLMEQACRQAVQWPVDLMGQAPYVSVNLSARQLHVPGLVGEIVEILDRTGLPPTRLQLEITESAVVVTDTQTVGALEALAGQGVRLAIDDFGTGYANFAYLYDLPVHGIKLASRLLPEVPRRTATGRTAHVVMTALVSLGRTLGLTVTAEGIETSAQAGLLRTLGCHVGQGWHLGHPVPACEVPDILAARGQWPRARWARGRE